MDILWLWPWPISIIPSQKSQFSFKFTIFPILTLSKFIVIYLQENERLKLEILEQNNKVQEQNKRISDMLEKNQK